MDGASRSLAEQLQQVLPQAGFQAKGLLATEGLTTIPNRQNQPVLTQDSGFYEFLRDEDCLCAWELEPEQNYEVVLTTAGGLYRYRTGDLVRHERMDNGLPVLRFIGRSDVCSDLVGEKLTEAFVAQCLADIPGFRMLAALAKPQPHYTLITSEVGIEVTTAWLPKIEERLSTNPQYAYARKLGQLSGLTITPHPDPLKLYTQLASVQQRLGDIKVPALLPPNIAFEPFQVDRRSIKQHTLD
jgi:hypothetical protein